MTSPYSRISNATSYSNYTPLAELDPEAKIADVALMQEVAVLEPNEIFVDVTQIKEEDPLDPDATVIDWDLIRKVHGFSSVQFQLNEPFEVQAPINASESIHENIDADFQVFAKKTCDKFGVSKNVFSQILDKQKQLSKHNALEFEVNETHPHLFVTPDFVYIVNDIIGSGAQSVVYSVYEINTKGLEQNEKILKKGKSSFEFECNLYSSLDNSYINRIESYYQIDKDSYIGIASKCDSDLTKIDYKEMSSPARIVATLFLDYAKGLEDIHNEGIIHGDLKPQNLLVIKENDNIL